jgi:anti-sigma factor RsiW
MNHQPFENWILDELTRTPQEQNSLDQHLKECPDCYRLQRSWSKVQQQIVAAPRKTAPASFMSHWKSNFAARQKEQERRQARTLLISLASGAGAILIALAVIMLPDFSVISLLVGFLTAVVKLFSGLESTWSMATNIFNSAPTITLVVTGLMIAGWISLAAFAWGISIWRITTKGVKAK